MPRIAGVDIPDHKKIFMSLQSVYGVGKHTAMQVLQKANIDPDKRARELTGDEVNRIQRIVDAVNVEGSLRRMINDNVQRLKRIKSYRGMRHSAGLPTRGQRTRTNSRNARGGIKRRTVGAMTKEMAAKLDAAKTGK
jgi:small subunit ribosomal protein S13